MSNPVSNWDNNAIQFPRLIAELEALGVFDLKQVDSQRVIDSLAISMGLEPSEVYEIVDRAQSEWDQIKANTYNPFRN